jgi:DNA helicase-2/ATP-dependent DNA helicase PcrA
MAASSIPESKVGEKIILDSRQLEFIKYQQGCAVLHAPVGTGKTLVLAIRASEAIQSGVDPSKILCVTFTNRAADELRQRVAMKCGRSARHVVVRTFHSLCTWMLRCEAKQIGLPADFVIYDDDDSIEIIKECAKTLGINLTIKGYINEARDVLNLISSAKVDAPPKAYATSSVPEAVFQGLNPVQCRLALAYQDKLATHHALDFADLIYFTRAMLFTRLDIYKRWATRFSMIQVDEMQDTHMSEYQVLSVLAQGCKNMVLAGDFDQTIYEWRGSAPEQVLKLFKKEFQEVREFSFTTNYRTTRTLVDAAVHVASRYSTCERICPSSAAEEGEPVVFHFANDSPLEAAWVAKKVLSLKRASEYRSRDKSLCLSRVGVLTRTNSRAIAISEAFANAGIPHITVEQFEFFRRQEVKDAVAYLKFLFNPFDGRSLHRMLLRPPRNIGKRTIERIQAVEEMGLRLIDMVKPSCIL